MPSSLTFEEHLTVLERAGGLLIQLVLGAGNDAPVPTCPDWNALALLAHQAMIHRWATAIVLGEDPNAVPDEDVLRTHTEPMRSRGGGSMLTRAGAGFVAVATVTLPPER